MARLPSIGRSLPKGWTRLLLPSSVRGWIIGGFALAVLILAAVVAGSAWQQQRHRSATDEMRSSAVTHHLLDDALQNMTLANLLLERYLVSGNDAVVPAIRSSLATVTDSLAEARSQEELRGDESVIGVDDQVELERLDELTAGTGVLSENFEQVIALQQSGDAAGARQTLEAATPELTAFELKVAKAAEQEYDEVLILQSRADRASDRAFLLLIGSGAAGAALGLVVSVLIARSILRPLSSLQAAALAVAGGDLEARAEPTGPRELASLGEALNQMADSLLDASKRRELEAEREQALAQLQESEERFRKVFEEGPLGMALVGSDFGLVSVNPALCQMLGYTEQELTSLTFPVITHPEDVEKDLGLAQQVFNGEIPAYRIEKRFIRKNGEIIWVELTASVIPVQEGKPLYGIGIVQDVTKRKRAEEALREQLRLDPMTGVLNHATIVAELRELVRDSSDGAAHAVAMIDVDGMKAINDTFGHQVGDAVLMAVAGALSRDGALVGRYGGDEFLAILPGADRASGERYRRDVQDDLAHAGLTHPETGASVPIAVSIGLAAYPGDAEEIEDLIKLSDGAMYASRRQRPIVSGALSPSRLPGGGPATEMVGQLVPLLTSPGKLEDKLRLVAHRISVGAGYDAVNINVFTKPGGSHHGRNVFAQVPDELIEVWRSQGRRRKDNPLEQELLRTRRPLIMEDPQNDERLTETQRAVLRAAQLKSAIIVPLFWSDDLVGILSIASKREAAFTARDLEFLTAVATQIASIVHTATLVDELQSASTRLREAQAETVMLLAAAAEAHDQTTGQHLQGVRGITEALARELGYSDEDTRELGLAATLHDIGKIRVPDSVLSNPGTLTAQEWEVMKQHTVWGNEFLAGRPAFELAATIARSHHERWDGTGYPHGLSGEAIPEVATIVAVADSLDAMTNHRPYRAGRSLAAAVREIAACSGSQFSPKVVEALVRLHKRKELSASPRRRSAALVTAGKR